MSSLETLNGLGVTYKAVAVQPEGYQALLVLIHMKNLGRISTCMTETL